MWIHRSIKDFRVEYSVIGGKYEIVDGFSTDLERWDDFETYPDQPRMV